MQLVVRPIVDKDAAVDAKRMVAPFALRAELEREYALGIDRAAAAAHQGVTRDRTHPGTLEPARDTRVPEQSVAEAAIERETPTPEPVAAVDLRTGITAGEGKWGRTQLRERTGAHFDRSRGETEHIRRAEELIRRELWRRVGPRARTHLATELLVRNADLARQRARTGQPPIGPRPGRGMPQSLCEVAVQDRGAHAGLGDWHPGNERRSEERRVGKECRSRWSPYHYKKKTRERSRLWVPSADFLQDTTSDCCTMST